MSFEFFVSLRYLLAKRRQTFISLITFISVIGVAVGVTALIVVLAVMNGFHEDLRNRILGVTSHVIVGDFSGPIAGYEEVREQIEAETGVVASTPFVYTQVMISSGRSVSGAILRGIDPQTAHKVVNIQDNMVRGSLGDLKPPSGQQDGDVDRPGILLGAELANNLGVRHGDWVTVISPSGRLTPLGQAPRSRLFQIVGIIHAGMYEYDNTLAYVHLKAAQQFLAMGDAVTGIEVKIHNIYHAREVSDALRERLGHTFWVRDWMQMNQNLFAALKLEKVVMFIILTLIILVAAFNIVSSLIMLVMEKTKDIAILKAMGATAGSIRKIFVMEGFLIGISGTTFGLLGGYGLCALLKRYQFVELPRDVYYLSTLPVKMQFSDVVLICFSAVVISLLATLYPSRQAAKMEPSEALRYE